jgi:exopolysaccharide biosynthesis polyprenyl glycosylphosphotransferase
MAISVKKYHQLLNLSKFLVEVLAVFSLILLIFQRLGDDSLFKPPFPSSFNSFLSLAIFFTLIQALIFIFIGFYRRELSFLNFEDLKKAIQSLLWGSVLLLFFLLYRGEGESAFHLAALYFGLAFALISSERSFFYELNRRNYKKGLWVKKVAIYDACPTGRLLLKKLFASPQLGYLPVGFIDNRRKKGVLVKTNSEETKAAVPVLGNMANFGRIIRKNQIEELFIATPALKGGDIQRLALSCKRAGIDYRFVPNLLKEPLHRATLQFFGEIPFIKAEELRINLLTLFLKRVFDLAFSVLALFFLSPVFLLISYLIKKDSPGPVFFGQKRVGKDGRLFTMYKFRTMKAGAKHYEYSPTNHKDQRITPLGRFLRRTSLDELPQFFNSLKGEMSVVGPRPEMEFIVKKYTVYQRERLLIKPGITGVWQVTADRKKQIHENMDYDIYYIKNASLVLDFLIIFRTFWFAVRGIGGI